MIHKVHSNITSPALLLTGILCLSLGAIAGAFVTGNVLQRQATDVSGNSTVSVAVASGTAGSGTAGSAWLGIQADTPATQIMQNTAMWKMPEHDLDKALEIFPNVSRDIREASVPMLVSELSRQRPTMHDNFVNSVDHPDVREIANAARDNLVIVANADMHFAELDTVSGTARIEKMWTLFQALGTHDPERIKRWISENPISPLEQQAIQQYAMTQARSSYFRGFVAPPMYDHYLPYGIDY